MERRRLPRAALRGAGKPQIEPLRAGEPLRDVVPVPEVPDRLEVLVLLGLVLQVVGVLPAVEDEERNAALGDLVLVVVDLRRPEALDDRIPDQRRPAGSHQRAARLDHLLLEIVEAPEVARDELGKLSGGLSTSAGGEVLPEDAVQDVAAHVEGELLLEGRDRREVRLLAGGEELLDDLVRRIDVLAMMLVVVELHDAAGDVRLEGSVVVRQIWQDVAGPGGLLCSAVRPARSALRTAPAPPDAAPFGLRPSPAKPAPPSCKRASARAAGWMELVVRIGLPGAGTGPHPG